MKTNEIKPRIMVINNTGARITGFMHAEVCRFVEGKQVALSTYFECFKVTVFDASTVSADFAPGEQTRVRLDWA